MSVVNEAFVGEKGDEPNVHFGKTDNGTDLVGVENFELRKRMDSMKKEKEEELLKDESANFIALGLTKFWAEYDNLFIEHGKFIKRLCILIVIVLVILYIGAVVHQYHLQDEPIQWCQGYGLAFIVFCIFLWGFSYYLVITPYILPPLMGVLHSKAAVIIWRNTRLLIAATIVFLLAAFLIWDTAGDRRRLISVGGLFTFLALGFVFSKHPTRIKWSTVFMGILIQFLVGLFAIRWRPGRQIFECMGNLAEEFLEYAYVGASFVYGDTLVRKEAVFAFQALSAIFFVSMIVQVLFYVGWMQVICLKLGWFMQTMLGTTVMESVNAVSSVFLGMTEAPLLYKPYIKDLTLSEMHAVMAGGFSTIAGSVFAAYASFGVDPANIITASIMTAPAN